MRKLLTVFIGCLLTSVLSFAHEGHNKTPGSLAAPHGGKVKGTSELYIELVSDAEGFKIYLFDHDMKAIPSKDLKIDATIQFPKKSKSETIKLTQADDFYGAKVDSKGAHRYTLELKIGFAGKTEKLSFTVEPH